MVRLVDNVVMNFAEGFCRIFLNFHVFFAFLRHANNLRCCSVLLLVLTLMAVNANLTLALCSSEVFIDLLVSHFSSIPPGIRSILHEFAALYLAILCLTCHIKRSRHLRAKGGSYNHDRVPKIT